MTGQIHLRWRHVAYRWRGIQDQLHRCTAQVLSETMPGLSFAADSP